MRPLACALVAAIVLARAPAVTARPSFEERAPDEVEDAIDHDVDDERARDEDLGPALRAPGERVAAPPIGAVLTAAYAAAGLDQAVGPGFVRRARLGGLVPWISVRTGTDARWREADPDVGRGTMVEVRATWRLDRLVFDPRELQVAAMDAARRRERRRLADQVIRTYFAWRRAVSAAPAPRAASGAEQAAAELDALTDGWFSEAILEACRREAEARAGCGLRPAR